MDRDAIARDWRARGFGCDLWTDPPGQVRRPAIGEEVLIPARTPHTVINVGTGRNRWLYGYARD